VLDLEKQKVRIILAACKKNILKHELTAAILCIKVLQLHLLIARACPTSKSEEHSKKSKIEKYQASGASCQGCTSLRRLLLNFFLAFKKSN
jgi:hypothetical protein